VAGPLIIEPQASSQGWRPTCVDLRRYAYATIDTVQVFTITPVHCRHPRGKGS
jgi:hypothetical protein